MVKKERENPNIIDNFELIQQRMKETEKQEDEPQNDILSESDLGSELDDELFNISDIRKY